MMTQMRQMSKAIFIIVALAFIGLIVFEWGADSLSRSNRDMTVGEVNGNKFSYSDYEQALQQLYQAQQSQNNGALDERTQEMLRNQVWEQFVQRTLLQKEMDELGITVSDSEIVYQIMNYPLDQLKKEEALQTNGVFDMRKYRAAMANPNVPWGQIEQYYRQQIPFEKLKNIITNTVIVSDLEVLDEFQRQNLKAKVEYLAILPALFQTGITVSDDEIQSYYDAHKDDYKRNEMRDLSYVLFANTPTAKDTQSVFEDFDKIKERLSMGEDFNTLASEYSEDPSVTTNKGELGYFEHDAMVKPFADAAFAAKPGDIVGPIKTSYGYHLIKVEDKKVEDGKEKVKASHILIKITARPSTLTEQEDKATQLYKDATDHGWDQTIKNGEYTVKTTGFFEKDPGIVPVFGRNPGIINFSFTNKKDAVSNVFTVDQGYVVFKINDIKVAGFKPLDDVKELVQNKVKLEKARAKALSFAENIGVEVKAGKPFREIADADTSKKIRYNVSNMFSMDQSVTGIGRYPEFNATAFTLKEGETSDLIKGEYGFYFEKLLEKTAFDSSAFNKQKESIRTRLLAQKKNQVFSKWMDQLKENADIVDNRSKFNIY